MKANPISLSENLTNHTHVHQAETHLQFFTDCVFVDVSNQSQHNQGVLIRAIDQFVFLLDNHACSVVQRETVYR